MIVYGTLLYENYKRLHKSQKAATRLLYPMQFDLQGT
jgi:hypothetical protein